MLWSPGPVELLVRARPVGEMLEMFHIFTVQYGSYLPRVVSEHLKCG